LFDLKILDLDPKLKNIYGKFEGADLEISNQLHRARGFRKIHLEIANLANNLEILHCVFFPDPRFDLPIFGIDVVCNSQEVSAAIVDLSPVSGSLPSTIESSLKNIPIDSFKKVRTLPEWGHVFSPYVCFVRPNDSLENKKFLKIVDQYLNILISYSFSIDGESAESPLTIERYKKQQTYCLQQKLNDKTRTVLARMFNPIWADYYIDMVLFNCPDISSD